MKRYIKSSEVIIRNFDLYGDSQRYMDNDFTYGTLSYYAKGNMITIKIVSGVEYGIVGQNRSRGKAKSNLTSGWTGYKIENNFVYCTRWCNQPKVTATKWLKEAMEDPEYDWVPVGGIDYM